MSHFFHFLFFPFMIFGNLALAIASAFSFFENFLNFKFSNSVSYKKNAISIAMSSGVEVGPSFLVWEGSRFLLRVGGWPFLDLALGMMAGPAFSEWVGPPFSGLVFGRSFLVGCCPSFSGLGLACPSSGGNWSLWCGVVPSFFGGCPFVLRGGGWPFLLSLSGGWSFWEWGLARGPAFSECGHWPLCLRVEMFALPSWGEGWPSLLGPVRLSQGGGCLFLLAVGVRPLFLEWGWPFLFGVWWLACPSSGGNWSCGVGVVPSFLGVALLSSVVVVCPSFLVECPSWELALRDESWPCVLGVGIGFTLGMGVGLSFSWLGIGLSFSRWRVGPSFSGSGLALPSWGSGLALFSRAGALKKPLKIMS